jgi:molybdopterin/thiamine biosynthesis adenylyltransferase
MNNFVMIGAGGTGTHLLRPLTAYLRASHPEGDWLLHVVDGDTVEAKNLERQLFTPGAVTLNKAAAAVSEMADDGHIRAITDYLSETNMATVIQENDTVLICVDNFTVRKRIEDHCLTLTNVTVINGGNEKWSGSVQIWVREGGENKTPRISYMHPEVAVKIGDDRAEMTCAQAAALPGGEQTLIANAMTATWMLTALWRTMHHRHELTKRQHPSEATWTELQFDFMKPYVEHIDHRLSKFWNKT